MSETDKIVKFPDRKVIDAEAVAWVARLDGDAMTDEDHAALQVWKAQSPQHKETLERLSGLWGDMDLLSQLEAEEVDLQETVSVPEKIALLSRYQPVKAFALAASLALAVIGAYLYISSPFGVAESQVYSTGVGGQRMVDLADGSSVLLNTDSQVEVRYSGSARSLRLVRGEAYFDVAPEAHRPFSVYAGDGLVEAIGTAFTVYLNDRNIEVTVTEGEVALASLVPAEEKGKAAKPDALAKVKAGGYAVFNQKLERLETLATKDLNRKLSWREGVLFFAGDPLAKVVEDISRYTDLDISIEDEAIRAMRIGGYFKVGDVDAMFEALETSFGVHVERTGGNRVLLTKAS